MNAAELKLEIFRQVDRLDKSNLEAIYGILMNYINNQYDISEWNSLSDEQQKGIYTAIDELENGRHILNEDVIEKYKKRYSNE